MKSCLNSKFLVCLFLKNFLDYPSSSLLRDESPVSFFTLQKKTIENLTKRLGDFSNLFTKMPPLNEIKKELRYHTQRLYFHRLKNSSKW